MLLSSTLRDDNATLICDLTNPDLYDARDALALEHDMHASAPHALLCGRRPAYERLAVRNFDSEPQRLRLGLSFRRRLRRHVRGPRHQRRERRGLRHAGIVERQHRDAGLYRPRRPDRDDTRLQLRRRADTAQRRWRPLRARSCSPARRRHIVPRRSDCAAAANAQDQARPRLLRRRCGDRGGRCARLPRAPRRSPASNDDVQRGHAPRRSPTSTCWSPTRRTGPIPTPASPGSARCSAATR